ncbi:ABC transporter ATP-binding protein [Rhodospira trueperi]|uniref:Molybdate transport system ATP-binding protein/putative spermidine/putrescine transport system ATP-binding protein/putrescine transport system ATP-binding protein n=1 Tax=Rhodospira trueperi TaxID=69960 RepID=A0A1G7I3J6_9PROT|nr:ATP-binding cassette domain-containing protein [Rhodospira trueperi]SDF07036.1 molybdate transport system ATP-binding protein/putative spermidine/putrescine transport system ATP-binding protein/putrescine transport system ATP-binding protein [Rhodospira trueperi]
MTAVLLENVSCRVLASLSLTVADREAVAILGPSGAGKSTLLKVVAGLLPHAGEVFLDGQPARARAPHGRQLGYLSQDLHLFPHLTVAGNVRLALLFGFDGPERRRDRVDEALHLARADHLAARRPATLSGGERQRAALARCLARRPRLLLLDEPFSSLDADTKRLLWADVTEVRRRVGMTALIVTHDPEEAAALADRVLVLRDGRLTSDGPWQGNGVPPDLRRSGSIGPE